MNCFILARAVCCSVALPVIAGGCTSTKLTRVARYDPGRAPAGVVREAPASAAYRVKYADASGTGLRTLGGTRRIVGRGDTLGFVRGPGGTLVAVAGEERIPLDKLPASARYCVWIARREQPSQFTREVGKAVGTAAVATATGAAVAGLATGAVALEIWEQKLERDACAEDQPRRPRYRRHHRHGQRYQWVSPDPATPPGGGSQPPPPAPAPGR
jgi:hypothetical protein